MAEPVQVLWHTDPSVGDPDDDYTAALIKALVDEGKLDLVGTVVNRQPAQERAEQFASTLAALGVQHDGRPVPVGIGATEIGRPMAPVLEGAPTAAAPAPVDGRELQRQVLADAAPGSLTVLVTTAATDVDWLLEQDGAREKIANVVLMGDAKVVDRGRVGVPWVPGDATNNMVDLPAAERVFSRLQSPEWRHVGFTVVSRWAVLAGGQLAAGELDALAERSEVARWLRDRAAASLNERWTSFASGAVRGRSRETFVENHLGGRDPGRDPEEPVFDLITQVPLYDALVPLVACEPDRFDPAVVAAVPNVQVVGLDREWHGVREPDSLRARLAGLLSASVAARPAERSVGGAGDAGTPEWSLGPPPRVSSELRGLPSAIAYADKLAAWLRRLGDVRQMVPTREEVGAAMEGARGDLIANGVSGAALRDILGLQESIGEALDAIHRGLGATVQAGDLAAELASELEGHTVVRDGYAETENAAGAAWFVTGE